MENQPNQSQKVGNKALWIILIIVILAIAAYGIYAYVVNNTNENSNQNTNTAVNTNSNSNQAANTNSNTNATANANANTNTATNTNIDTSGWKTYTNVRLGFRMKVPTTWSVVKESSAEGVPYVQFTDKSYLNSDTEYPDIVVSKHSATPSQELEMWVNSRIKAVGFSTSATKIMTSENMEGYKYQLSRIEDEYAFLKNNSIFVISVSHFQRTDVLKIGKASVELFEII